MSKRDPYGLRDESDGMYQHTTGLPPKFSTNTQRLNPFTVPPGHEAVRDAAGRAPGAIKKGSALDTQVGGNHYTKRPIQPFEYSMRNGLDPMQHTIIKYVTRFRDKEGREDLEKARHTIDLLIENDYGVQK